MIVIWTQLILGEFLIENICTKSVQRAPQCTKPHLNAPESHTEPKKYVKTESDQIQISVSNHC